ncbi:rCG57338 [Rattus norvegicus]|uniref:RCG57338 n=1 Tax=Rattus norvegicus TaxID=10116 RepID=A6JP95_RAT|nr:rCG57338 [Rattus norvegicus]
MKRSFVGAMYKRTFGIFRPSVLGTPKWLVQ